MPKQVILYIATSIDGFIAKQDGGIDWLPSPEDPLDSLGYQALLARTSVIAMGSKSYEQIVGFGAWAWPQKQTHVFTSRKLACADPSLSFVDEKPSAWLAKRQADDTLGDIWLLGGAELTHAFAAEGLIDECIITVIPITLREGIKLVLPWHNFAHPSTQTCVAGMVQHTYRCKS